MEQTATVPTVNFEIFPDQYKHWKLSVDGHVATLAMDVREDAGLRPHDYKLKLNSYDLGVDIELADILQRLRFEHPEVHAVVLTSLKPRIFCAGANIFMLGSSSHGFKVNFCKFTNETRLGMEDLSVNSGIKFLAAINGICAGGGYELALACDEIYIVDDGSASVALPETPLLGVLPGTGGLTRVVGITLSTRRQSTARLPRTPSVNVPNASARSRRTLRLSTTRVRPPVPGNTPSSGVSGRLTAELPSSTSRISSQASASS